MSAGTSRIITPLIVAFVLLTSIPTFAGRIIYVDDDGPADFNNIQAAINYSSHGDTIIVAEGRYFENINFNGRNITLTSTDPCNPDVVAATIIDGNQKYSVVTFNNDEDPNCILNGFTITNGHAVYGGGIYCTLPYGTPPPPPGGPIQLPERSLPCPTITNCIITGNIASDKGGGIYCGWIRVPLPPPSLPTIDSFIEQSSKEISSETNLTAPTITSCFISNNSAKNGGGMFTLESSPTLTNCSFSNNSATDDGGGMFNCESSPTLANCTFSSNSARDRGGGMNNFFESSPTLTNCTFNGNSADLGGGMCNFFESSPTLSNCNFSGNSALCGGGIFNENFHRIEINPILTNCIFSGNYAEYGAGMSNHQSSPTLTNCTFNKNSAGYSGGGMGNYDSSPTLKNCTFSNNSASHDGGGMYNSYSNPTVTNCIFSSNCVESPEIIIQIYPYGYGFGGGMCNYNSIPIVDNCMFTGNAAGYYSGRGGGIYNAYSNSIVTNCTFSGNRAGYVYHGGGEGMYNHDSYTMVSNCIFWNNGSSGISVSSIDATYCNIEGGWPGEGNIDADPCFVDPGYWDSNDTPQNPRDDVWIDGDYHLLPDSPCINTGDPNHLFDPNEKDLDGNPRVVGCRIDMGVFEYRHVVPAEVRIVPHTINLANRGKWITAYLQLPEEYNVSKIDLCILLLEDKIEPEQLFTNEKEQAMMARFNDEQLYGILNIGDLELTITVHLTNATVFEGTDIIKVIYEGGGRLAKLGKAVNPNPADGATNVGIDADLRWTVGSDATSHDVYFGTSSSPPFVCNQTAATFDPGTMSTRTKYFWRIDEVNKWGKITGDLWSFTIGGGGGGGGGKPPGAPPGCFPADTPVWIDGAQVQFSKVAAGRKVGRLDATDAESCFEKPVCLKEIESVLEYQGTDDYYNIVLENGNRINVVHSHYFLTASDQWVLVENLKVGSKLQSLKGPISIRTIEKREVPFTGRFYNLKIKGGDRYFVGKDGVAVRGH